MEPDWDLHAVVRGFATTNNPSTTAASHFTADIGGAEFIPASKVDLKEEVEQKRHGFCSKNLAEELHELFTPYRLLNHPQTGSVQPTISSYLAALEAVSKHTTTYKQHKQGSQLPITNTTASAAAPHSQTSHKPKRRKFQVKKISHVPAEALSSDVWAWRKYGQKPIKGSPYPRGYYKCSSSKACLARKQVERNRSDPTMFIVTCTGDHNHPAPTHKNSLAGTTRNPNPLLSVAHEETSLPTSKPSSSSSMENMSTAGSLDDEVLQLNNGMESNAVDMKGDISRTNSVSDVLEFLDMDVTDDFFDGLGEIAVSPVNRCFPDPILASFTSIANNVTTAGDKN